MKTLAIAQILTLFFVFFLAGCVGEKEPILQGVSLQGDNVRLRSGPGADHEVLEILKAGSIVDVYEIEEEYVLIDKYYGRWSLVSVGNDLRGYVLSCFLKGVDAHEPFHVFAKQFLESWQYRYNDQLFDANSKKHAFFEESMRFPLIVTYFYVVEPMPSEPIKEEFKNLDEHDLASHKIINASIAKHHKFFFHRSPQNDIRALRIHASHSFHGALIIWHVINKNGKWHVHQVDYSAH